MTSIRRVLPLILTGLMSVGAWAGDENPPEPPRDAAPQPAAAVAAPQNAGQPKVVARDGAVAASALVQGAVPGPVVPVTLAAAAAPAPAKDPDTVVPGDIVGEWYSVTLRRSVVSGVVRPEDPWEVRKEGDRLRAVSKGSERPGLRLWYVYGLNGSMFVSADDIVGIEALGSVGSQDAERIARDINSSRDKAGRERTMLRRLRSTAVNVFVKEALVERLGESAKSAADEDAKVYADLLQRFPTSRWGPDTPARIARRVREENVPPNAEEEEFLRMYDEWRLAVHVANLAETSPRP